MASNHGFRAVGPIFPGVITSIWPHRSLSFMGYEGSRMFTEMKIPLKKILPTPVYNGLVHRRHLHIWIPFLLNRSLNTSLRDKIRVLSQLYVISSNVECLHTEEEILSFIQTILCLTRNNNGVIVEAGCYKGGSAAKFSLVADI